MLRILAPLLMSGTLGWLVLRLFIRPLGIWLRTAFYLAFGLPIGAGLFGISSFLTFLVWRPEVESILVAFLIPAALAAAAALLQSSGKMFRPVSLSSGCADRGDTLSLLAIVFLFTCFAAALLLTGYFMTYPHGMWDAHAMWNARARVMFRAPDFWRDVLLPIHPHPDYPLTLSTLVFTGWAMLGRETQTVPISVAVAFLFAGPVIVGVGLTIWKSVGWGLAAASLILSSIGYVGLAGSQYADIPLSVLMVASVVLFTLAYRNANVSQPTLALAGGVAALCGWLKNEGILILFGFIFGLTLGCILLHRTQGWLRQVGSFSAGAVLPVLILQYYRSLSPSNALVLSVVTGGLQQKILDPQRWLLISKRYADASWSAPGTVVPLAILIVFLWVVAGIRLETNLRLPLIASLGALLTVAAGHFGAYLVSPYPLMWHLDTSVNRLALQLMPTLIFVSFALVRADFFAAPASKTSPANDSLQDSAPAAPALVVAPPPQLTARAGRAEPPNTLPSIPLSELGEPDGPGIDGIVAGPVANPRWYAVPFTAFVIAEAINKLVLKQHMVMLFPLFQLLEPNALKTHLVRSLLLLHGQPPLLNLLAGIILKLASMLGCTPETLASVVFAGCGLATGLLLFYLTNRWTRSRVFASAAVVLYFANPSYYGGSSAGTGRNDFFYEFLLQPLLLFACLSAAIWLKRADYRAGLAFVIAAAVVANTRTLFHPLLWGVVVASAVLLPHIRKHTRSTAMLVALAFCLLSAWAVKNYVLFGVMTSSTWDGFNLDRDFAPLPKPLRDLDLNAPWPDATNLLSRFPRIASWPRESLVVVTSGAKSCGGPNWNNLLMVTSRNEAVAAGLAARKDLAHDLDHVVLMYKYATRPMYMHPYLGQAFGAYPDQFTGYLWLYDRLFFFPLSDRTGVRNTLHWNILNVLVLPMLLIGSLVLILCFKNTRILVMIITYTAFFPIISACLSDGFEGNRMRHSTYPLMILLSMMVIAGVYPRLARIMKLNSAAAPAATETRFQTNRPLPRRHRRSL